MLLSLIGYSHRVLSVKICVYIILVLRSCHELEPPKVAMAYDYIILSWNRVLMRGLVGVRMNILRFSGILCTHPFYRRYRWAF